MVQSGKKLDLIDFDINNVPLQALRGMTWGEFAESEYNVEVYDGNSICRVRESGQVQGWDTYSNTTYYNIIGVYSDDVIEEGRHYSVT